ncbi:class I SAM-dependent methyltransferase [Bradyrhizobium genosp. P]|uniref:class I SAM-dependent methyltransferase n=1 Tax=Bradyrhizobium genosp. P TaxID=83641 RepID=UPI003CF27D00
MTGNASVSQSDIWSDWLLRRRNGSDQTYERSVQAATERFCKRVLDNAELAPGMTLADIGTGKGLVAFGGIDRIGPSLRVIFTDISEQLLAYAEATAIQRNVSSQCTFLQCSAERLAGIQDATVDVVTTRSVLAYVSDKPAALREFLRILKPGGRISIAEPVFLDDAFETVHLKGQLDAKSPDPVLPLMHRWKSAQFPDTLEKIAKSTLARYSERDLLRLVHGVGFSKVHLELHIDIIPGNVTSWDVFIDIAPHPLAPTLREILEQQFTLDERVLFENAMRPTIESGQYASNDRMAYFTATKPSA